MKEAFFSTAAKFWDWIDDRLIIRRIMALGIFGLVWKVMIWSLAFAYATDIDPIGKAAILAAINAPLSLLMKFMFDTYSKSRGEGGD